jgi:Mor family transcriptional regulator
VVSTDAVSKLCAHYAGSRISYIPKLDKLLRALRDEQIREDCKTLPRRAVALKYGLSIQAVYDIAGDIQRDTVYQISLF